MLCPVEGVQSFIVELLAKQSGEKSAFESHVSVVRRHRPRGNKGCSRSKSRSFNGRKQIAECEPATQTQEVALCRILQPALRAARQSLSRPAPGKPSVH